MADTDTKKQRFRTVEANVEEMEQKIRRHRKRIALFIAAAAVAIAVCVIAVGIYFAYKEYRAYKVLSETKQENGESAKYESFAGNILRYNNDGVFYTDMSGEPIWNQSFEMQHPAADVCEDYAAIADISGRQISIMNADGGCWQFEAAKPIRSIRIAAQGTVAVLTAAEGSSYIEIYDKTGESLVSGEFHMTDSGCPLDIALSKDANKMAASILSVGSGKVQTSVVFYNFGSVGQSKLNNVVSSYTYSDTVIPKIEFVANDKAVAFADNQVIFFEGKQNPEQTNAIPLKKQVKSIFYDSDYFGLAFDMENEKDSRLIEIYDMDGTLRLTQEISIPIQSIDFLDNHEICVRNEYECEIYTLRGLKKFAYAFDHILYQIFSDGMNRYTFVLDDATQNVKLR